MPPLFPLFCSFFLILPLPLLLLLLLLLSLPLLLSYLSPSLCGLEELKCKTVGTQLAARLPWPVFSPLMADHEAVVAF